MVGGGPICRVAYRMPTTPLVHYSHCRIIFALPSRSDSFGLVLLEAWANAVPCVVYRAGGPADLVRHGVDGLQAPCGDVESLGFQRVL